MLVTLGRKLPKPVQFPLRWVYDKWRLRVTFDNRLIGEMAEYFELSFSEVKHLMKSGIRLNADLWRASHPRNEKEIAHFYAYTPFYVFELAYWHMQQDQRSFRQQIMKASHGNVLDFGGGIGDLSVQLAERELSVTYADIEGKTFDFASWLFQKRNTSIKVVNLSEDGLKEMYDTIICIDVIEHVPNSKETLSMLIDHLNDEGILIITNLEMQEVLDIHPMHNTVNFGAEKYLKAQGLKKETPWLWIKH